MPCPKPQPPKPRHVPMSSLFSSAALFAAAGTFACALASAAAPSLQFNTTAGRSRLRCFTRASLVLYPCFLASR